MRPTMIKRTLSYYGAAGSRKIGEDAALFVQHKTKSVGMQLHDK